MKYQLDQLVDLAELQALMDSLYRATGINHALLDREGRVLTAIGWKKVCTEFHRVNPRTCERCLASDQYIFSHLMDGPYVGYECMNGLFDYATPVFIDGEHVANIFTGQILHEPPDLDRFGRQAEEFDFDRESYLDALQEVNITARERMPAIMDFLVRLAQDLGSKGLMRLRQLEAKDELWRLNAELTGRVQERTAELSETNRLLLIKEETLEQGNSQLKRLNRTLLLLSESNSVLLQAENEDHLLPDICRVIVEKGGYPLAWVGFAESDTEKTVRPVAYWGDDSGFLGEIRISWGESEFGLGPTGRAIRTGKTQVISNNQTAPGIGIWRDRILRQGYRSGISLPLVCNDIVLGALSIHASEVDAFGPEEVGLLEKLAHNLAFGIEGLRARRQLAIANQELQAFTYAASHDLKAPLTRINSFSTLLERNYRELLEGNGLLFLDYIRGNATRMTALIDDMLAHAQIELQASTLEMVDLSVIVQSVISEKRSDILDSGAELRIDVPDIKVWVQPMALGQVLRNLLDNALKYSARKKPPIIEIGAEMTNGLCRLRVRDNGVGFDMAYHDRIFEIFRRLYTYDEFPGSGIGLALVKKAMERMNGRVWAESEPGKGATFFLEMRI